MLNFPKIFLIFLLLAAATWAFPATQKSEFVIPKPLTFESVLPPTIDDTSSGRIVYIPLLNSDNVTITLYQVNMNTASGTLLNTGTYTLPQSSINPIVSLAGT
jgi:hypothetical protein